MKTLYERKGFTLVEMLIVIAIIAILASVALVSVSGVRQSAADTKRISDVNKIQQQLEVYYTRNGSYPPADGFATLKTMPGAAINAADTAGTPYLYAVSPNGQHYVLGATLAAHNAIMNEPNAITDASKIAALDPGLANPGCNNTNGFCIGN